MHVDAKCEYVAALFAEVNMWGDVSLLQSTAAHACATHRNCVAVSFAGGGCSCATLAVVPVLYHWLLCTDTDHCRTALRNCSRPQHHH